MDVGPGLGEDAVVVKKPLQLLGMGRLEKCLSRVRLVCKSQTILLLSLNKYSYLFIYLFIYYSWQWP